MRFSDFLCKLYERFSCTNQGQFVLELISALCGEVDPIRANRPSDYAFSDCLPSGLSGSDATSRKRLYGNSNRYKGLTGPVKRHIQASATKESFIAYCEASVSIDAFQALCKDFNVSHDLGRALIYEGIYVQFLEFAKSSDDSVADSFIADYVTAQLMKAPVLDDTDIAKPNSKPICAGDDILVVRQATTRPCQAAFYDKLTHYWVVKNSGVAVWDGRYMEFINHNKTPLKLTSTRFDIIKTPPGGEVTITVDIDARHMEGTHEIILDMKDSEGRLCFPDKRAELRLSVAVGWRK